MGLAFKKGKRLSNTHGPLRRDCPGDEKVPQDRRTSASQGAPSQLSLSLLQLWPRVWVRRMRGSGRASSSPPPGHSLRRTPPKTRMVAKELGPSGQLREPQYSSVP